MKKFYPFFFAVICILELSSQSEKRLPDRKLSFVENRGQVADQNGNLQNDIRFIASVNGIKLFIADGGLHYIWQKNEKSEGPCPSATACEAEIKSNLQTYRIDVKLLNPNIKPEIIKEGASRDYTNYYLSHCPGGITYVRSYEKVTLKNIYKNIDWVFYINDKDIEYDFLIHPGGNPADIAMQVEGATDLQISEKGSLILTSPLGTCEQLAPIAIQNGKPLDSRFILNDNIIRLKVDLYDPTLALNIDPVIKVWGTYYGGAGEETVTDLKTDNSGNVYMAGSTSSTSNISTGAHQVGYGNGDSDGFLVKFDGAGNRLWATYYGGDSTDIIYGCATDQTGNVFISGTTMSSNAIAFNGFKNSINNSPGLNYGSDAFLVKLNSGGVRQWGTYLGSLQAEYNFATSGWDYVESADIGYGCATDLSGNVYICGKHNALNTSCYDYLGNPVTCANTYIATSGAYLDTTQGYYTNPFLVKFNSSGSRLWGTYYGFTDYSTESYPLFCATDRAGNVFLAGSSDGSHPTLPNLGFNGHQNTPGSDNADAWLVKFNPAGNTRLWSTYYGGYGEEHVRGLCTDSAGNVFISGHTASSNSGNVIATTGAFQPNLGSSQDPFLVKFNAAGTRQWGTYMGDITQQYGGKCAADNSGNVIVTFRGQFISGDAGWVAYCGNTHTPTYGVAISRFDANGNRDWAEVYRSWMFTYSVSCAVSPDGRSMYIGDYYDGYQSNVPLNAFQNSIAGGNDAYLICFRDSAVYDTICGYVFDDLNGNGVQDFGEGYLSNIEVYMSVPSNGPQFSAFTNAGGYYQLQVPRWGTSGFCNSNLVVSRPADKIVSIPIDRYYPGTIVGNSPGCIFNFGLSPSITVSGNVYYDTNHDAVLSSGEPGIPVQSVSFSAQRQAFVDDNGDYDAIIPAGNYTETFDRLDAYSTSTSNPANYNIYGTNPGSTFTGNNFGAYFTPSFVNSEVNIWQFGIPPVVGLNCKWMVRVSNLGTLPTTDTLVFHYDPNLIPSGSGADTVAHTITFITSNIVPARKNDYTFTFQVRTNAIAGTVLHNWVGVNPALQPDTDVTNNRDDDYSTVLSSYDPNNKISETNTPNPTEHITRNWSNGDDYIRYVINFQNTGTYTAYNVVINDTLSSLLDPSSVHIIKSSHTCVTNRNGNTLNFNFSNINLTDSASNEPLSKGYVVFKVKPASNANPGDSIVNRAAIYFDYNHAILTAKNVVHLTGGGPCTFFVTADLYDTACTFQYPYMFEGRSIYATGIYRGDTVTSIAGCDSVTILHLAYHLTNNGNFTATNYCSGGGTFFNGVEITSPGFYSDTVLSPAGCDSVINRYYWSAGTVFTNIIDTLCDLSGYPFGNDTIFWQGSNPTSPIHRNAIYQSVGGCDSVVDLSLYLRVKFSAFVDTICSLDPYVIGNDTIYLVDHIITGSPYLQTLDTVRLAGGCDSLIVATLLFDVNISNLHILSASAPCGTSGNAAFSPPYVSAHVDAYQVSGSGNCPDVYITWYLPRISSFSARICPGDSFNFNNRWLKYQGLYRDTLQALCGDDSIVELHLDVNSEFYADGLTAYLCPDSVVSFRDSIYTLPGYYSQTVVSGTCPDTIYSIYVYEDWEFDPIDTFEACLGERVFYEDTNFIFQQAFSYFDTVPYWDVCTDSIPVSVQLPLRVEFVPTTGCYLSSEFDSVRFPNCHDRNGGYLHVGAWGGMPPYTYRWNTGATTIELSNLTFGKYTVTVFDALGDSAVPYAGYVNNTYELINPYPYPYYSPGTYIKTNTFDSLPGLDYFINPSLCYAGKTDTTFFIINWYGSPYSITEGDTTYTPLQGNIGYGTQLMQYNLGAGHHSLTVSNSYDCVYPFDLYIPGDKMEFENVPPVNCSDTPYSVIVRYTSYNRNNPFTQLDIAGYDSVLTYLDYEGTDTLHNLSSGYHAYTVTNASGCSKTDSFFIGYNLSGMVVSVSDQLVPPCGAEHLLTATASSGVPPYNFHWNTGSSNDTILTNAPGSYSLQVSDSAGCSIARNIQVAPEIVLRDSINASICTNQSYNFNGHIISQSGIYRDTLVAANTCDSIVTLNLATYQPIVPLVSRSGDTLICTNALNYQWYHNGNLLPGANSNRLILSENGSYYVTVNDLHGCPAVSSTMTITGVGITNIYNNLFVRLFPNPAGDEVVIETNFSKPVITIQSLQGQQIREFNATGRITALDISDLAAAVYLVKIVGQDKAITLKFIKE